MKKNLTYLVLLFLAVSCMKDTTIKRIQSTHFDSIETQRATLDSLVKIIQSSKGQEKSIAEKKFLAAFPATWRQYKALYEDENLYTEQSHIYVLGHLESVDHEMLFNKVIDFSINGKWEADFLQDFYLYDWFFDYGDELVKALSKRNDNTIKNIFRFIFDGAHPKAMIDRYRALHCKLDNENKRLANLLEETYNYLLKAEAENGHGY